MGADAYDMIECPACHLTVRAQPRCEICGSPMPTVAPEAFEPDLAPEPDGDDPEARADLPELEPVDEIPPAASAPADAQTPASDAILEDSRPDGGRQPDPLPVPEPVVVRQQKTPPPPAPLGPPPFPATGKPSANAITRRLFTDFEFKGRMAKRAYWRMFAWRAAAALIGALLIALDEDVQYGEAGTLAILAFVAVVVIAVSGLAEASRRLHDTGKPGLWNLLVLIPYVGFLPLLYLLAQDGQPHDNPYGPPPAAEV
ncbi:DUF805 domain-containing protein [Sphingomonas gei]|nr:DUF805 domain-containing protein [Sphingomonas gei]